jgi:hypothetical protein
MEKTSKYHVVIKPALKSKLKFNDMSEKVVKKAVPASNRLPPEIGYDFANKDEMIGMPAVREERMLKFKDFL